MNWKKWSFFMFSYNIFFFSSIFIQVYVCIILWTHQMRCIHVPSSLCMVDEPLELRRNRWGVLTRGMLKFAPWEMKIEEKKKRKDRRMVKRPLLSKRINQTWVNDCIIVIVTTLLFIHIRTTHIVYEISLFLMLHLCYINAHIFIYDCWNE